MIVAILSLQSWQPFLQRWLRACEAADDILKSMRRLAEKSIPRSAENIGLAIGVFCLVLPLSAHATKASAPKFLLSWFRITKPFRNSCNKPNLIFKGSFDMYMYPFAAIILE